ncbi:SRPBCC family protein [Nonomuraea sp. NBC_01738]|uniref:SRPBCC family protein n=1 Tax=Nonomuraea sp. NBC_01738 TaxID=2976003 RepID=UPI002E0FEE7B|nr:SRPBCC family protein [Nonomuraea sp. NBC_01738]
MIDINSHIKAIQRSVTRTDDTVAVVLGRTYDASVEDVWDALTDPERIARWFMPIHGDLKVGGTFQLEGNAGGEILACEPPDTFTVTFGGDTSVVVVRLTGAGEATDFEMTHTVPLAMAGSGAGAMYVGPGWDGGLLGLGLFLSGEAVGDPVAAASSPEAVAYFKESVLAWEAAVSSSGTATAEELEAAKQVATAQFAPEN